MIFDLLYNFNYWYNGAVYKEHLAISPHDYEKDRELFMYPVKQMVEKKDNGTIALHDKRVKIQSRKRWPIKRE